MTILRLDIHRSVEGDLPIQEPALWRHQLTLPVPWLKASDFMEVPPIGFLVVSDNIWKIRNFTLSVISWRVILKTS